MIEQANTYSVSSTRILLLLLLAYTNCFTNGVLAEDKKGEKGNTITYKGNVFEFTKVSSPDTAVVVNSETGTEFIKICVHEPAPQKMNGKEIYYELQLEMMKKDGKIVQLPELDNVMVFEYLLDNLKNELSILKDGAYQMFMTDIVIDDRGKIVLYNYKGLNWNNRDAGNHIANKIDTLMSNFRTTKPATVNKLPVTSSIKDITFRFVMSAGKAEAIF